MMLIRCPWCGPRDHTEFSYLGDATVTRPNEGPGPRPAWVDYVYLRANPKGPHVEYWHHHAGCRQWVKVARDTVTHAVTATCLADRPLEP